MNKPRLIDANKLKEKIKEICGGQTEILIQFVDDQPTAYDIDKVVKQLEEKSFEDYYYNESVYEKQYLIWKDRAIEIVKGGAE